MNFTAIEKLRIYQELLKLVPGTTDLEKIKYLDTAGLNVFPDPVRYKEVRDYALAKLREYTTGHAVEQDKEGEASEASGETITFPETERSEESPVGNDLAGVQFHKREGNPANAAVVCSVTDFTAQGKFDWNDTRPRPPHWPKHGHIGIKPGSDAVNAVLYIGVMREGKLHMSKFDWSRYGQSDKDFNNIESNYTGLNIRHGEQVCLMLTNITGTERSNVSNWTRYS